MADAKLKDLNKKRASLKGKLTLFVNFLNVQKTCTLLSELQVAELDCRLSKIEGIYGDYDALQGEIELLSDTEDQLVERDVFESQYYGAIALARTMLAPALPLPQPPQDRDGSVSSREGDSADCKRDFVRLPKIELPAFDGDYQHWLGFRDMYISLIHNNKTITDIQKYYYLRAALKGRAALLVNNLDLSSNNYSIAWQLISERYDNQKLLVNNHLQSLFDLELMSTESGSLLRNMVDVINKNLRALATLGEPTDHWDTIIVFLMSKKLDSISVREWEEHRNNLVGKGSPTLQQFLKFLNNRADLLETIDNRNTQVSAQSSKSFLVTSDHSANGRYNNSYIRVPCPVCSGKHPLFTCRTFRNLDVDARIKKVTEARVCKNCLRPGHSEEGCSLTHCKYCDIKHNTLLHKDTHVEPTPPIIESNVVFSTNTSAHITPNQSNVLLSTALVRVRDARGILHSARLLLDNGSTSNFVTQSLCDKLGLVRRAASSTVSGINNQCSLSTESCDLVIESCLGSFSTSVSCFVIPEISKALPSSYIHTSNIQIPAGIRLADPSFNVPSAIQILVGAEVFWNVLGSNHIDLGKNLPKLHESRLGWLISGCVYQSCHQSQSAMCHFIHSQDEEALVSRFWELDSVSSKQCMSQEERACELNFQETTRRCDNGQFVVTIPLKESPEALGDSYTMAKCRFLSLERRLERDADLKHRYNEFIKEYILLGHMTENNKRLPQNKHQYFLPHHCVLRESSATTKLRVVFDASAKSTSGKSFNDIQMVGPTVQDDVFSILLRFRQHRYVVTADVEKMFRAVLVEPCQRPLQQIIFRFDSSEPLRTFTLDTVSYGTASAGYLATKCLVSLAEHAVDAKVKDAICHNFYCDDYLYSGSSVEEVINTSKGVIAALESAKFNLRKWQSNSRDILESISKIRGDSERALNLNHSMSKTLGLFWFIESDHLFYSISSDLNIKITKRNILSLISQVFDPLGLVGPCIVEAKIIFQKLWTIKCSWDDEVPCDVKREFIDCMESLQCLNSYKIPRWISNMSDPVLTEVHTFADASERAYGACVYVRTVGGDGTVCVRLLASKNKVAPLKPTTIPRLELCGALLGSRLCGKVVESLTISVNRCYFWSDSMIVLGWLSTSPSRLNSFVRNRVSEIQDDTAGQTWSYVPSKDNPADLVSRGAKADHIKSSSLWWSGPDFLQCVPIEFPVNPSTSSTNKLPETCLLTNTDTYDTINNSIIQLIHNTSNFIKLIRIFGYVQRFINNCRHRNNIRANHLSCSELNSSKLKIIHISQKEMFPEEYKVIQLGKSLNIKNRLISLTPFIDCNQVIRVGGRLNNSNYSYDVKHPILLCSKHHVTKIIFEMQHKILLHAGPQLLLANMRHTYWPLGGRNLARAIVHNCARCARFKAKPVQPIMGDLPLDRTNLEYPFLKTGVDYCGPVLMLNRKGRGATLIKSYICIFVCLAVKAVHLELVTDLTKEAYLAALYRFVARRGKPQTIHSDNGTNFVGACNLLYSFLKDASDDLTNDIAKQGIEFKYIPVSSPNFGGLWEACVKSTKHHLRRILGLAHLTYEELSTCLAQIEAVLNSRPLTPLSPDPSDLSYLSPAHFLIGRLLTSVPHPHIADTKDISRLQRWQRVESLKQHFWNRFSNEYISTLQQKQKWRASTGNLALGDMVLVREANLSPLLWMLGRVTNIITGSDDVGRVADVLTKKGVIRRSFNRLCPIPC